MNYDHLAAVVLVTAAYRDGHSKHGDRWYRILNMEGGRVVQSAYKAAASLQLSCRAYLGYRVDEVDRALRLVGEETTLVQCLVGMEAPNSGWYEQDVPVYRTDRGGY